jgi:short-subunit dehydrogenase
MIILLGIVHNQLLTHQKSSSIQDIININLLGTTYMCKSMIKQLVRNKEGKYYLC